MNNQEHLVGIMMQIMEHTEALFVTRSFLKTVKTKVDPHMVVPKTVVQLEEDLQTRLRLMQTEFQKKDAHLKKMVETEL